VRSAPQQSRKSAGAAISRFWRGESSADQLARRYRREGDTNLIELRLTSLAQLFNTLDPSPFHEPDLDPAAHEYIVSSTRELSLQTPLKLVVHLSRDHAGGVHTVELARAIHNYFGYRHEAAVRDLRFQLRVGRTSALIGTLFLAACVGLRQIFFADATATVSRIVSEGLLISGWVAMWRPLQIFLYDWWPLKHRCDVYAKLATIPVEVRANETDKPPSAPL
jgi:hypothetical protein